MAGLLDRLDGLTSNPLIALGTGLLGASGYSKMPISTGQALAQGFQNMQRSGLLNQRSRLIDAQIGSFEDKRRLAQLKAQQAEQQRQAQVAALVQAGMPQSRAETLVAAGQGAEFIQPPPVEQDPWRKMRAFMEMSPEERAGIVDATQALATPPVQLNLGDAAAKAAAIDAAKRERQQADAQANLGTAMSQYEQAYEAWKADPSPLNKRMVDESAIAVALARQSLLNQGRELGGPMQRKLTPPGVIGRSIEEFGGSLLEGASGLLGGDGDVTVTPLPPIAPGKPPPTQPTPRRQMRRPPGFTDEEWNELEKLRNEQGF